MIWKKWRISTDRHLNSPEAINLYVPFSFFVQGYFYTPCKITCLEESLFFFFNKKGKGRRMGKEGERANRPPGKCSIWRLSCYMFVCVFVCFGERVCCVRFCRNSGRRIINWTRVWLFSGIGGDCVRTALGFQYSWCYRYCHRARIVADSEHREAHTHAHTYRHMCTHTQPSIFMTILYVCLDGMFLL